MLPAERHQIIIQLIKDQGSVSVEQLIETTGASKCTIRRDLDKLASQGLISRTYGGAILPEHSTSFERLYPEKRRLKSEEKKRIGKAAAELVADGESLILDSGSTTLEVARNLADKKNLKIITNDIFIAVEIAYDPSTEVIVCGGSLRPGFNVLQGVVAEQFLRSVHVDRVFASGDAIDQKHGVTNATFYEAALKKVMIAAGRQVHLVIDHTKFGKVSLVQVAPLSAFDTIITDSNLPKEYRSLMDDAGIRYVLA